MSVVLQWEIDKDMMNNCFICSRESYDFERQLSGASILNIMLIARGFH